VRSSASLTVLLLGMCAWSACGTEPAEAPAPEGVAKAVARKAVADAGVPSTVEAYIYSYSSLGKRDPFRAPTLDTPGGKPIDGINKEACDEPLCQMDIDELRLVAVVSGDANPVAMVEDRGGVGHVVRRNTKIGRQGGKVTAVLRDCLVVTSFVVGSDGRAQPNRQNLCVITDGQGARPDVDLLLQKSRE
jgi:type IV pilus assembly protein PilP